MTEPAKRRPGRPRKNPVAPEPAADEAPKKRRGRPPKKKPEQEFEVIAPPKELKLPEPDEPIHMSVGDVYGGVSPTWLAHIFGMDKNTISKKLAAGGVEVVARRNGGPLYRIPDAAAVLVKPKVDLVAFIKSLRPNDLPPMLNEAYWSAMLKRQKWEENAGDLWRTADVLEVLGDLAFSIKTTVNLWVEEVDRTQGLTSDQRKTITQLCDKLLEQIHQQMVEAPRMRKTPSSLAEEGAMPEQGKEPEGTSE